MTSSVIRAILGGLWHLPLLLYSRLGHPSPAGFQYSAWIAQKGFLVVTGTVFLMFLFPWSIFYSWVFNNTGGSLLLVAVLHGSEVWLVFWLVSAGINPSNLDNYWSYGAFLVVTAVIFVITTGPQNLSRKRNRIRLQSSLEQDTPAE